MVSARDLWRHQASRGIWVLGLHGWLQSTKSGELWAWPCRRLQPPVPAILSPAPSSALQDIWSLRRP